MKPFLKVFVLLCLSSSIFAQDSLLFVGNRVIVSKGGLQSVYGLKSLSWIPKLGGNYEIRNDNVSIYTGVLANLYIAGATTIAEKKAAVEAKIDASVISKISFISSTAQTPDNNTVNLFVITGESNSGGYALNSQAPSNEIGVRNEIKILNNSTFVFENLNIGSNNLIDHAGLSNGVTHGFELAMANAIKAGTLTSTSETYLVKTGQGGSRIGDWAVGGSYWSKFTQRVDSAKAILRRAGKTPVIYVIYSQGINDAIANYSTTVWKDSTVSHFKKIRAKLGFVPILMTKFMSNYAPYNTQIDAIGQLNEFNIPIVATDATLRDSNHWDYAGFITIFSKMIPQINRIGGNYLLNQNTAMFNYLVGNTVVSQVSGSGGGGGNSTNLTENVTWGSFVNASQTGNFIQNSGGTPSGGRSVSTIDATQQFSVIIDVPTTVSESDAVVTYLDNNQADTFAWIQGKTFVAGIYQYGGSVYGPIGGYGATATGGTLTGGEKIKLLKSGNDLLYQISTNSGTSYTTFYTGTNALSGFTTVYLKALFAVGGSYKIKITTTN